MKSQKGITLIALVITIIVMLILVAVTITMAVNGGLFDTAKEAGRATNEQVEHEQELASGKINVLKADGSGYEWVDIEDFANRYTTSTATSTTRH